MARTVRDSNLETRTARAKLKHRGKPYFRLIEHGRHLGYRRTREGGAWIARMYAGGGTYATGKIATADDTLDADGHSILTFAQAQERARGWFAEQAAGQLPKAKPYSVRDAIVAYMDWYSSESASDSGIAATKRVVNLHILPKLGDVLVADLTTDAIDEWRRGLAAAAARKRSKPGAAKPNTRPAADDKESKRQRKATANRILTVLKAALNRAFNTGKVASDDAWRRVKPFRSVDAAKVRCLTKAECQRLVNAAAPDLRTMIRAALLTGCRYGELAALKTADFNPDARTVTIRHSKAGKPRHVPLDDDTWTFFVNAVAGRKGGATMFLRADGKEWGPVHQVRPMQAACERGEIEPAASFHILRHTFASHLAMAGVPMAVIAAILGHGDTRMTEKHYAHLSPDHVALTLRANAPTLGIVERSNVVMLGAGT